MILVVDCGLSFVKVALADRAGRIVHSDREAYRTTREDGRAEQDPEDWWRALRVMTARLPEPSSVEMVVPTGHMHALVLTTAGGVPLLPCLTLHDRRGAALLDALEPAAYREATGQLLDASLPLSKLLWLKDEQPELLVQAAAMLSPKDYLGLRMTGTVATDPIDAAGTGMFDPLSGEWSDALTELSGVPNPALPEVYPPTMVRGNLTAAAAADLGLPRAAGVLVGAGDDIELLGATAYAEGAAVEHVGTTGAVLMAVEGPPSLALPGIELAPTASDDRLAVAASTSNCGTVLDWIRTSFAMDPGAALMQPPDVRDPLATTRFWPPRDGSTRSGAATTGLSLSGIHPTHTREDLARALLVGVAGEMRTCMRDVEQAAGEIRHITSSGGREDPSWVALRANAYGRPITTIDADPTALGCVGLALVALGEHADVRVAVDSVPVTRTVTEPNPRVAGVIAELLARAENARMAAPHAVRA
ncbi:MAG: xylulokinase [Solirubrobacteraceae bacterium]|nr:xylulokinase [Solirubrobacteraceae bacterium]